MQAYFTLLIGLVLGALIGFLLGQRKKPAVDISAQLNKELSQRDTSIEMKTSLEELSKKVTALSNQTAEADKARATADAALKQELTNMASINTNLLNQSTKLAGALASSQTRGKYGEAQLETLLESAGLIQGVHYEVQRGTTTSEGVAGIPDVKISMPGGLDIYIDSKFPFANYFAAIECDDLDERARLMKLHADDLLKHITDLAKRKYSSIAGSANFVVVFAPFESILAEALIANKTLLQDAFDKNITVATPSNMLALLRTVSMGYSRSQLAENAHNIQIVAGKLVDKISTAHEHIDTLGKRILSTASAFNQMVGTVGSAVTKDVNEMIDLGLPNNPIDTPKLINPEVRSISGGSKMSDFIDVEADE
jgi:DNA recombination protein RmuC